MATDRAKMDEYLTAVRDVEQRIETAEKFRSEVPEELRPNGVPENYSQHIRAMYDLMTLAFRTDSTRISTFLLAHDGSNRTFPEIGVADAHHQISHHQHKQENLDKIALIDRVLHRTIRRLPANPCATPARRMDRRCSITRSLSMAAASPMATATITTTSRFSSQATAAGPCARAG